MPKKPNKEELKDYLDKKYDEFHDIRFIDDDPIQIPHLYTLKEDIEIMGFFASILAWGQRKTIINKCKELHQLLGEQPHDFIINHSEDDLKPLVEFKHRTFNGDDLLYFIAWFKKLYETKDSLETAFTSGPYQAGPERYLANFRHNFFKANLHLKRTEKHISSPLKSSACKRINMFLRWMVRDKGEVDFGIWKNIKAADLICPCDVHVERVARRLNLIERKQMDWKTALELTENLKSFDLDDPVKYDFALFGIGVYEKAF